MDQNPRSREALGEFLDYLADKGLMAQNTVSGRKAATKVLDVLDPAETEDVTAIDVDDVVRRFGNLHAKDYTPESLTADHSRLRATLEDFRSFVSNPLGFRPAVRNRTVTRGKSPKEPKVGGPTIQPEMSRSVATQMPATDILPIPIRADVTVRIHGLPFDLTEVEANKIAAVVKAMANPVGI